MKRPLFWIGCIFFMAGLLVSASTAWADRDRITKTPDFSAYAELEHISDELHEMWEQDPEVFIAIEETRTTVIEWSNRSGHRPMNVARLLEGLGEDRLLAMLWVFSSDNPLRLGMDLRTWRSWRIGLLESIGRLRDERSIPVLKSIIMGNEPHAPVRQVATSALGRGGDEESIKKVIEFSKESADKREAIIAGLGDARRFGVVVDYLLEIVDTSDHHEERRLAVRALGDWANQWAWETSSLEPYAAVGQEGRKAIIESLVILYSVADELIVDEIGKTLQLAGASDSRVVAEKRLRSTDDVEHRIRLQHLVERLTNSPLN